MYSTYLHNDRQTDRQTEVDVFILATSGIN